jgi:hypothetical protein
MASRFRSIVYNFVRRADDGRIVHARLLRFDDGSASASWDNWVAGSDGSPTAWERLCDDLLNDGFIELADARQASLIPLDWTPPPPPDDGGSAPSELLIRLAEDGPTTAQMVVIRRLDPHLRGRPLHEVTALLRGRSRWSLGPLYPADLHQMEVSLWEAGFNTVRVL